MSKCGAVQTLCDGLMVYVCELDAGHTARHRERDFTWLDREVIESRIAAERVCGATCPNVNGGPDFVCQRPPHKLYPAAKHWSGGVSWTQAGADKIRAELAAKQEQEK